jgi:hypothetical protein
MQRRWSACHQYPPCLVGEADGGQALLAGVTLTAHHGGAGVERGKGLVAGPVSGGAL